MEETILEALIEMSSAQKLDLNIRTQTVGLPKKNIIIQLYCSFVFYEEHNV